MENFIFLQWSLKKGVTFSGTYSYKIQESCNEKLIQLNKWNRNRIHCKKWQPSSAMGAQRIIQKNKKNKSLVFYDEVGKWLNKNKFLRHFCYNLCKALQLKIQVPKFRLDVTLNRKEKLKKYLYHFIKLQNFPFLPSSFIFLCDC